MLDLKSKFQKINKSHLQVAGVLLLIALAIFLLWFGNNNSMQASSAMVAQVYFDGEYSVAGGPWTPIVEGGHIPATKGDVTLRGNMHMRTPYGDYIGIYRGELLVAFYINHINVTIMEADRAPYVFDMENPLFGPSACGVNYSSYALQSAKEDTIEILVHNPHSYGNETAIDEMLSNLSLWAGIDFEKDVLSSGEPQRNVGMLLILVSIVFLGIALFSSLIHIENNRIIWLLGAVVLFAGFYVAYSAPGVSFWSESIVSNTTILGTSMMFYMLFLTTTVSCLLKLTQKVGNLMAILSGLTNAVCFILPIVTDVLFYDTWVWWGIIQMLTCVVLAVCLMIDFSHVDRKKRWLYLCASLPLLAFITDFIGIGLALWRDGLISECVFIVLFVIAMIMVLKLIPQNINAATKAKALELEKITLNAQLAESRISTMMSQIRPHFIYNTLGSIEQLCKLDPPKAGDLVHNFAKYLRGNFGELDNPKPILMSQEMKHVHHYISIENVRFPDMTFTFEMNSDDFHIPALTVQPIVENAIKHGLMKLPKGGTINVVSYETDTDYCISVVDDGVGFDTNALLDDRKHVGLRNIRERLKVMVNGTLEIESTVGVGTKVLIKIPKEGRV